MQFLPATQVFKHTIPCTERIEDWCSHGRVVVFRPYSSEQEESSRPKQATTPW